MFCTRSLLAAAIAVAFVPDAAAFLAPSAGLMRSGVSGRATCVAGRAPGLRMVVDDKTEVRLRTLSSPGKPAETWRLSPLWRTLRRAVGVFRERVLQNGSG